MSQPATVHEYALKKTAALLEDVVHALHKAAAEADEDAIHKMRVSIRRLQQALRLFRQYFNAEGLETVKDELRAVLKVAGEVRNRDIAMALVSAHEADISALSLQRSDLQRQLVEVLQPYRERNLSVEWRRELGLESV